MINFKDITLNFFKMMGVKVVHCDSDEEARQRMLACSNESSYPVYFFKSDTSGEKLYEEFYTKNDSLNLEKFKSLGVILNPSRSSKNDIQKCISSLKNLMDDPNYSKGSIISVMKKFISDFDHMETGKNLDQKM